MTSVCQLDDPYRSHHRQPSEEFIIALSARRLLRTKAGSFAVARARDVLVTAARAQDVACTTARTRDLFARQGGEGGYGRLDLIVALMALSEAGSGQKVALQLLRKLLPADQKLNVADHALVELLERSALTDALYVSDSQVVAVSGALGASVAPLALAIHRGKESMPVRVNPLRGGDAKDRAWLIKRGFTADEIARIEDFADRTYGRLGIRQMPWNSISACHREMEGYLDSSDLMHGMGSFYQSCEELLVRGQRPTTLRFQTYGLEGLLTLGDHVLDIGCNNGFFSLKVAEYVNQVDGFDISQKFVNVANSAKKFLGVKNCSFYVADFSGISPKRLYDVVFSFAVHHWIGMPMRQYADRVKALVREGGHVLLESQDLATHDVNWEERLSQFMSAGFVNVGGGTLCDDGYLVRNFVILKSVGPAQGDIRA